MKMTLLLAMFTLLPFDDASHVERALEERLMDLRSDVPAVRVHAARSLGHSGNAKASPALIKALEDKHRAVRRAAARALGLLRAEQAVKPLTRALQDSDVNVRLHAAYALGEIKDAQAVPSLLKALADADYGVRDQAAWALAEISDASVIGPLTQRLTVSGTDVRQITWLLRRVGGPKAAAPLTALLGKPDPLVRRRAVKALSALEEETAVEPLLRALEDVDHEVRAIVVDALRELREERVLEAFRLAATREKDTSLKRTLEQAIKDLSRDHRLAAHWSFDDSNFRIASDSSGNGVEGRILGCKPIDGMSGRALRFAPGHYIELGKPESLKISGRPMTVMAWVKSEAESGVVVARGGAFCGYSLYVLGAVARFGIQRVQDGPGYIAVSRDNIVGSWVHLAGVIDRDQIRLYVDGKEVARTRTAGYLPSECGQGMQIGFDVSNSPAETCDGFQGIIDEVKAFSVALPREEIAREAAGAK